MIYAFAEPELDEARGELRRAGVLVPLEPKPFAVLRHLIRHRQRVVSKAELLQRVWPDLAVADSSLSSAIASVRRALRDTGAEQRFIHTLRGRGFRFVAPAQEMSAAATPGSAVASAERGDFVGRAEVLARLDEALEDASFGRGRIVLLTGEPGIGKTRTAEELARGARGADDPPLVLTGWCASQLGVERLAVFMARDQGFLLRALQGRLREMVPVMESLLPGVGRWAANDVCARMWMRHRLGHRDAARRVLEAVVPNAVELPVEYGRFVCLAQLSEVAAGLGDRRGCERLLAELEPEAGLELLVGGSIAGCVSRPLGLLARALGRFDEAERHFEVALDADTRIGLRPWVAETQLEYAALLLDQACATAAELGMAAVTQRAELLRR